MTCFRERTQSRKWRFRGQKSWALNEKSMYSLETDLDVGHRNSDLDVRESLGRGLDIGRFARITKRRIVLWRLILD